jgi:hypothetical protein
VPLARSWTKPDCAESGSVSIGSRRIFPRRADHGKIAACLPGARHFPELRRPATAHEHSSGPPTGRRAAAAFSNDEFRAQATHGS